jgi:2-polyprenyl-6-methoxyphenol hydroxylase-like FAD-dependent oxidoreductase
MLAAELTLAGIDAVVVERRTTEEFEGSRAGGLHARTIEILDQRGIAERFVPEGQKYPASPTPESRWTSATSPAGTTTFSASGSAIQSVSSASG